MTIVLTYITEDGSQESVQFEDDVVEINLEKQGIVSIDLTSLTSCKNLQYLGLHENQLQSIDLTPLRSCTNLEYLELYDNQFQTIDLSSLAFCTSLYLLTLGGNQLQFIDLAPLSACSSLQALGLDRNKIQFIDLAPLSYCTSLEDLGLSENQLLSINLVPLADRSDLKGMNLALYENPLRSIDISPLSGNTTIHLDDHKLDDAEKPIKLWSWFKLLLGNPQIFFAKKYLKYYWRATGYTRPKSIYPWYFLHQVAEKYGTDRRIQQDILCAMGLDNYGFIDSDLRNLFLSLPRDTPIEIAREQVTNVLVDEIAAAVDRGGATTGLSLEKLLKRHVKIAQRAQRIIELRKAEMQNVQLEGDERGADLSELWLTAYGYEVLSTLPIGLTTALEGLEVVKTSLHDLGFELKTGKMSCPGAKMSDELRKAIGWIVFNVDQHPYSLTNMWRNIWKVDIWKDAT